MKKNYQKIQEENEIEKSLDHIRKKIDSNSIIIAAHKTAKSHNISDICHVLKIPRSTFYKNSISHVSLQKKRHKHFRNLIKEIYFASGCRYGAPKIAKKLQHGGEKVSEKLIGNLMHELGLCSIIMWTTDITYIHTCDGCIFRQFLICIRKKLFHGTLV